MSFLHKDFARLDTTVAEKQTFETLRTRQESSLLRAVGFFGIPCILYLEISPTYATTFIAAASPILIATFSAWFMITYEKVPAKFVHFANLLSAQILEAFISSTLILIYGLAVQVSVSFFGHAPAHLLSWLPSTGLEMLKWIVWIWFAVGLLRFGYQIVMSALRYDLLDGLNQGLSPLAKKAYQHLSSHIQKRASRLTQKLSLWSANFIIADVTIDVLNLMKSDKENSVQLQALDTFFRQNLSNSNASQAQFDEQFKAFVHYFAHWAQDRGAMSQPDTFYILTLCEHLGSDLVSQEEADIRIQTILWKIEEVCLKLGE